MLKLSQYPRQSSDPMQSLSKYQGIFHITRTNNSKTLNRQNSLEKEEAERIAISNYSASWFQTIGQNYGNENSMVLAGKQTYRSGK